MIEKDSIVLEETGSQNAATLFQFVSKDFDQLGEDGELSNGWRDILLDIREDAKNATENIESIEMVSDSDTVNKETEVSSGGSPNSNTAFVGVGEIPGPQDNISIVCRIRQRGQRCRIVCQQFGRVFAVRRC